jgi:hypothetical protein
MYVPIAVKVIGLSPVLKSIVDANVKEVRLGSFAFNLVALQANRQ